ncbi:cold-shock protein [Algibacter luteus]|uniref:Cold-shock DNA-binding protein family n=1 Tax=Algibacter luteus TaxID=1178825 RepID=A0A1M6GX63_9FLAO|nr:cold shock domain-containing protein [Algibacter luteus]SHJ14497.1 cold-shock DNA-binding protein family [Algibacter luteus]
MAKSQVTFNKIEKEKKRLKKREEKQKKKEARRAEAKENPQGIQFAYVDFNGNLTDTPPDPALREKVEAESIELGIPKKEDREEEEPAAKEGKVSFFDHSKGFGFIIDSINQEKYFVHVSGTLEPIEENDKVTYELERGQKGMNAVRVKKI